MKTAIASLILATSLNVFAQEVPSNPTPEERTDLRKRTHAMSWELARTRTNAKNKNTDAESETSYVQSSISYRYNFGRLELGGSYVSSRSKNEDTGSESLSAILGLIGHFNILENTPGNDLVPYLSLALGSMVLESDDDDLKGGMAGFGVGLKWFPLSEIFALTAELGGASANIEGGSPNIELEIRQGYFTVGWALYF